MGSTTVATAYRFAVGEEVVVRLRGVEVFDLDMARVFHDGVLPHWTIAEIVERTSSDGTPCYTLRFVYRGAGCLCVVPEAAIDGTA
jgi:hypothetical protein